MALCLLLLVNYWVTCALPLLCVGAGAGLRLHLPVGACGCLPYLAGALLKLPVAIACKPACVANQLLTYLTLLTYVGWHIGCARVPAPLSLPIAFTSLATVKPAMVGALLFISGLNRLNLV